MSVLETLNSDRSFFIKCPQHLFSITDILSMQMPLIDYPSQWNVIVVLQWNVIVVLFAAISGIYLLCIRQRCYLSSQMNGFSVSFDTFTTMVPSILFCSYFLPGFNVSKNTNKLLHVCYGMTIANGHEANCKRAFPNGFCEFFRKCFFGQ